MGLVWFLVLYLLFATSSPAESQGGKLALNDSGIHLSIHHVRGPGSILAPKSPLSWSEVLQHDENRVDVLNLRLAKKGVGRGSASSEKSKDILWPNSVGVPLNPGLSIGIGNYYLKVGLGTPPKYYSLIMDTGSSLSWLQCKPCIVYCHPQVDPLFDPSSSKTYKTLLCGTPQCSSLKAATLNDPLCDRSAGSRCVYTSSYGDASLSSGYLSQDVLTLKPSETLPNFVYGCGQDNDGLFGRAAGIIGLARNKLSMLTQLSKKYGYAFSYCLPTATSNSGGGFLSIGQISPSPYKFTPMLSSSRDSSLYFLRLASISVAGRPLGVSASQYSVPTIIDSGTVITRLPKSVYGALQQAFVNVMSKKYSKAPGISILDTCFQGTPSSFSAVPEIGMLFQGGSGLALGAHNTLIEADKGVTCLAFASSGDRDMAIIGNYQQQTFSVAYDVSNSRIGFSPNGCR